MSAYVLQVNHHPAHSLKNLGHAAVSNHCFSQCDWGIRYSLVPIVITAH